MKKVILLALLLPVPAFGQIFENFESGNIDNWVQSTDGRWKSDATLSLSGNYSLHHVYDNPDAGIDQIGIALKNLHPSQDLTRWSFLVKHGYDPSSQNNWAVFLMSDNGPPTMTTDGSTRGFAIGVNLIGSDDTLRLWKVDGNQITTVIDSHINWQTTIGTLNATKIVVERSKDGIWSLSVSKINGTSVGNSTGTDKQLFSQAWFGIYYKYSSTRDRLLWVDDINVEGSFYEDLITPTITNYEVVGKNSLKVSLNEEQAEGIMVKENFSVNSGENMASSVEMLNKLSYRIKFDNNFINKSVNTLIINKLCDLSGNSSTNLKSEFTPIWAETGDIVITEIMADPLPVVSLPAKEYLEITNRTDFSFNLKNWNLTIGTDSVTIPEYVIPPSGIDILCADQDTVLFKKFGSVIGMKHFPVLNDEGELIFISDSAGVFIHGVDYSYDWYNDELKSDGGWSLEMRDIGFPFYGSENWTASVSEKGGTPGSVNSVSENNPDLSFYGILNVFAEDSVTLLLKFSEPVFNLSGDIGKIKLGDKVISDVLQTDPLFRTYSIKLQDPIERGKTYSIEIPELSDFAGNTIQKYSMEFTLPEIEFGQIFENFESGNIANWVQSTDGRWKADATMSLSGNFSLHHVFDNPDAGIDQIGIPLKNLHPSQDITRWSFLIKHGYDPSSQNNWAVFLMSDNGPQSMSTNGTTRGFAIGVNLIGSDDTLRLWKIDGNQVTAVVNSRINWQTNIGTANACKIDIERSIEGIWTVSVTKSTGPLAGTASGTDKQLFNQAWFGIYYKYSSTRDRLLWLDDIKVEGCFYEDLVPPFITKCEMLGKNSLKVSLNEEQAEGIMVKENFSVNSGENMASSIEMLDKLSYRIQFENLFSNKSVNVLNINKLCDLSGNCSLNLKSEFTPVWAETGDIVITEIMADPLPVVSLPAKEYLEITNRTDFSFNLKNWNLTAGSDSVSFPDSVILPSEITILCAVKDTFLFKKFGKLIGLKQFPVLNDEGKLIFISDSTGVFIHGVEYSHEWYKDELKSNGGWSLEMKDMNYPFYGEANWSVSLSKKGGTPGSVNSISEDNPDLSFYGILSAFPEDSVTIRVRFSEPVFNLSGDIGKINVSDKIISSVFPADPLLREFCIKLQEPIQRGKIYRIDIPEVFDFAGNKIQNCSFDFGWPEAAGQGDILFNEVLFNPFPGDPDYLELYNRSGKTLDASRLQLVSIDDATGNQSAFVPLCEEAKCILPGEYYAITTNPQKISERYFSADPDHLFKTGSLPSMNDDKGHLILFSRELEKIDELMYNKDMHFSLLSDFEGIALEKTNPRSRSEERANWHSATESSGWGTPGAPNSVFVDLPVTTDQIVFSSSKITPDNDGYEDFLTINLNLYGNGNVISIMVFDESGNYVRKLASNLFAGPKSTITWDGTADDGSAVGTGIYIIFITLYDDTGKTEKWKKVCTVLR